MDHLTALFKKLLFPGTTFKIAWIFSLTVHAVKNFEKRKKEYASHIQNHTSHICFLLPKCQEFKVSTLVFSLLSHYFIKISLDTMSEISN